MTKLVSYSWDGVSSCFHLFKTEKGWKFGDGWQLLGKTEFENVGVGSILCALTEILNEYDMERMPPEEFTERQFMIHSVTDFCN